MRQAIPDFPPNFNDHLSDFGRGGGGLVLSVSPGKPVIVEGCTIVSSGDVMVLLEVADEVTADNTGFIFQNNVQLAYVHDETTGWPSSDGKNSNSMYPTGSKAADLFTFPSTIFSNNAVIGDIKNSCPRADFGETAANTICTSPGLNDETYHLYGYGDLTVKDSSSQIVGFGAVLSDNVPNVDFDDKPRSNPPTIGAFEVGSVSPIPGTLPNQPPSSTATTGSTSGSTSGSSGSTSGSPGSTSGSSGSTSGSGKPTTTTSNSGQTSSTPTTAKTSTSGKSATSSPATTSSSSSNPTTPPAPTTDASTGDNNNAGSAVLPVVGSVVALVALIVC